MTSRKRAKVISGNLFPRIEIGPEVVSRDDSVGNSLDVENSLGRDPPLLPLGDGVGSDSHPPGQLSLGHPLKETIKGTVVHLGDYVHRRLNDVNRQLIVSNEPAAEHKRMVDTPRPGHFSSFAEWLEAVRRSRNASKAEVARVGGGTPQAASKWFNGGGVDVPHLRKLADWAAVEYLELRALLDKQPVPRPRGRLHETSKSGDVMRISRKLDQIAWDDEALKTVEALVDHLTQSRSGPRKRSQV